MRHIKLFETFSQNPEMQSTFPSQRVITVSFQIPEEFNSPGYWTTYEGEPLLTYNGPGVTDNEFLKIIADSGGNLGDEFEINGEILEELESHLTLQDLSELAKRSNGMIEDFEKSASQHLFSSFEEDLLQCSDVLPEGEDSIPFFIDYYSVSVE